MRRRQFDLGITLQAALLVAVGAGAAYWHLAARQRPLDTAQLRVLASQLQSQAAEAADISDKEGRGKITESFAANHAAQLRNHTLELSVELSGARIRAEYRAPALHLYRLSVQLANRLAEIPPDHSATAVSASEFARLARQAEAVDEQLTRQLP